MCQDLYYGPPQAVKRDVTAMPVSTRCPFKQMGEVVYVSGHILSYHQPLFFAYKVFVQAFKAGKFRIYLVKFFFVFSFTKDFIDIIKCVITGGSLYRPVGQFLLKAKDFFHHHINVSGPVSVSLQIFRGGGGGAYLGPPYARRKL